MNDFFVGSGRPGTDNERWRMFRSIREWVPPFTSCDAPSGMGETIDPVLFERLDSGEYDDLVDESKVESWGEVWQRLYLDVLDRVPSPLPGTDPVFGDDGDHVAEHLVHRFGYAPTLHRGLLPLVQERHRRFRAAADQGFRRSSDPLRPWLMHSFVDDRVDKREQPGRFDVSLHGEHLMITAYAMVMPRGYTPLALAYSDDGRLVPIDAPLSGASALSDRQEAILVDVLGGIRAHLRPFVAHGYQAMMNRRR